MVLAKRYSDIKHASKALIVELAVVCSSNLSMTWWIGATIWAKIFRPGLFELRRHLQDNWGRSPNPLNKDQELVMAITPT